MEMLLTCTHGMAPPSQHQNPPHRCQGMGETWQGESLGCSLGCSLGASLGKRNCFPNLCIEIQDVEPWAGLLAVAPGASKDKHTALEGCGSM